MNILVSISSNVLMLLVLFAFAKKKHTSNDRLWDYIKLFYCGALVSIPIIIVEFLISGLVEHLTIEGTTAYEVIDNFICTGFVEEFFKWLMFKRYVVNRKDIKTRYDAIVYVSFISMGFSVIENIMFVFESDLSTSIIRAVFSSPGHLFFSIFIGHYWFKARKSMLNGNRAAEIKNVIFSLAIPTIFHGFYDFCLESGRDELLYTWMLFVIFMMIKGFSFIKKSYLDRELMYNYFMLEDKTILNN